MYSSVYIGPRNNQGRALCLTGNQPLSNLSINVIQNVAGVLDPPLVINCSKILRGSNRVYSRFVKEGLAKKISKLLVIV